MSNTILAQYKAKFTKALDFIVEDLRLSEEEVQELLTWMTRNTRSRIFRAADYVETKANKEVDPNSFEAVFIPELDDLNTKSRPKEKKNEVPKPAAPNTKPKPTQADTKRAPKATPVKSTATGRAEPKGSAKPSVLKLNGINTAKVQATSKTEKGAVKVAAPAVAAKTSANKQVLARKGIKPIQTTSRTSKPKN